MSNGVKLEIPSSWEVFELARIEYVPKNFSKKSLTRINQGVAILEEYDRQGYKLTLRQLKL